MLLACIDCQAVVAGDSSYQEKYKAQLHAAASTNAIFTGYQFGSAYQQLTSHACLFVLAASVGGTHPVLVEQMAAGNPILARETDSNREVLGDAGLFWKTPEELAALLRKVWPDEARRSPMSEAARTRPPERSSWSTGTTP